MAKNMLIIQKAIENDPDVLLLCHSITPRVDAVEMFDEYSTKVIVNPNKWHMVVGDRDEIYELGQRCFCVEDNLGVKESNEDFMHTESFLLFDKNRRIRSIYSDRKQAGVQQLIAYIKALKKERVVAVFCTKHVRHDDYINRSLNKV